MTTEFAIQRTDARIAPLAVLPVFFDLRGKRAIIVGGTEPAGWKAELLAAAGADVEVYAEDLSPQMLELAERPPVAGSINLMHRAWAEDDLPAAALAVADIEQDDEAIRFVAACRAAATPFNVIDRPQFCQFQFGAIVNRSPLVVGISTAGAAPILGQATRRRIETMLPPTLGAWANLAANLRDKVMDLLTAGAPRRAFWEQFADKAFGMAPPQLQDHDVTHARAPATGRVTLVGAGPGEADLLTIKAVRALQSADVILFDDLVSGEVLELARREARRMLVGKRAGRESCRQEDINAMMIKLARQGKHVVRLKSGDPMIFGRAGEEIAELEAERIPVTVIPGITAGIALASRLGLSLTHRSFAQSVRFVTGHSRQGGLPEGLDWNGLADATTTTVYYMARRMLPNILARLEGGGMAASTPACIAINLGRSDEAIWRGPLSDLQRAAENFDPSAPTLIAIGNALGARAVTADILPATALSLAS